MLKKSLLSLAIAAGLGLAGCSGTDSTGDTGPNGSNPNQNGQDQANTLPPNSERNVHPVFYLQGFEKEDAGETGFPVPADLMYSGTVDGTFSTGSSVFGAADYNPVSSSIDDMTGASTTAAFDIELSGDIDASTVVYGASVFLVKLNTTGDPVLGLANGEVVDLDDPFGTINGGVVNPVVRDVTASVIATTDLLAHQPASFRTDRSRIRLTPTEPLDPKSRYLVILTNSITDTDGNPLDSSYEYDILGEEEAVVSSLAPIQSLIQGWETLAFGLMYGGNFLLSEATYDETNPDHIAVAVPAEDVCDSASTTYFSLAALQAVATTALGLDLTDYNLTSAAGIGQLLVDTQTAGKATYALTYTFTTEGTKEVLTGMASPLLTSSSIQSAIIAGEIAKAQTAKDASTPSSQCSELTDEETAAIVADVTADAGTTATAVITDQFSREGPSAREVDLSKTIPGAVLGASGLPANIDLHVGTIELPYYLTKPGFRLDDDDTKGVVDYITAAQDEAIKATGVNIIAAKWQADTRFAAQGTAYDALTDDQKVLAANVTAPSTLVTRLFPFAQSTGVINAPLVVIEPTDVACAGNTSVVVYQHGITTNRSLSLPMAASLAQPAAGCYATVAIDFPLHGQEPDEFFNTDRTLIAGFAGTLTALLSPLDSTDVTNQAYAMVAAGSNGQLDTAAVAAAVTAVEADPNPTANPFYDSVYVNYINAVVGQYMMVENHFNLTNNGASIPRAIDYTLDVAVDRNDDGDTTDPADIGGGVATENDGRESGSLFINLLSQQVTRDNLRQAVMNLLNLNASLDNIATAATFTRDTARTQFVGHSLGAIVGASATAVTNEIQGLSAATGAPTFLSSYNNVVLGNGGASLPKLIENSPAFSTAILGGLGALDTPIYQRSYEFETMLSVFQGALQSVDPVSWGAEFSSTETLPTGAGNYGALFAGTDVLMHKVIGAYTTTEDAPRTVYGDMAVPNNARATSEAITAAGGVYMNSTDGNDIASPFYNSLYPALPLFGAEIGNVTNSPVAASPLVGTDALIEIASGQANGTVASTYGGCTSPVTNLNTGAVAQTPTNGVIAGTNAATVSVIETCGTHSTFSGLEDNGTTSTIFSTEIFPAIAAELAN